MIGQPVVFLLIEPERFLVISFLNATDAIGFPTLTLIVTMYAEKIHFVPDVLHIHRIEIALAKGEVINGIHDICFAGSVITNEAVDLNRKVEISFSIILEICEQKVLQKHFKQFVTQVQNILQK
jgi:hypothetical protein